MAGPYPLATLAPTITNAGISAPSYNDIYQSLIASFQQIFGSDIYITPDSQDGQWLAVHAKAINDQNNTIIATYNSFSPNFAQGAGLSSLVKLNGLARLVPSNSTAVGNVTGSVGTVINAGVVQDVNGNKWDLPAQVIIPASGTIAVTVVAENSGATAAQIGDIAQIVNPQLGWQGFINTTPAAPGSIVEADGALRQRQATSVSIAAKTILASIAAAIADVAGVTRSYVYENATNANDGNGAPPNCFYAVVEGGLNTAIAAAIQQQKPPGIQSYGTTAVNVLDQNGMPVPINYYVLGYTNIFAYVAVKALTNYTSVVGNNITAALVAFIESLIIGEDCYYSQAYAAASLSGQAQGMTFYIEQFAIGTCSFTGTIAGNTLTVTAMEPGSAPIAYNSTMTIFGIGVTPVLITAGGTGTGGAGTYTIAGAVQNIAPAEQMIAALGAGIANITVPFNDAAASATGNVVLTSN